MTPGRRLLFECRRALRTRCRVRRLPLLLFVYSLLLLGDATGYARLALAASVCHEGGHMLAFRLLQKRWPALEVSAFGITLSLRGAALTARQDFWLALAGPAVNGALCAGMLLWMEYPGRYTVAGCSFAAVNLLVGAFNLLPVPGLDGARLLADAREEGAAKVAVHWTARAFGVAGTRKNCFLPANRVQYKK